jgi:hypothetical protein
LDLAQARTLILREDVKTTATIFSAALGAKAILLLVESQGKRPYLKSIYQYLFPELTSGIINQSFLWWLNGLFRKGYKGILAFDDLYDSDPGMWSEGLGERMRYSWDQRGMISPHQRARRY